MAQQTVYTKRGMMAARGTPVEHRVERGQDVYYKKLPVPFREQMYRAYDTLYSLGVGIPFTRTSEGVRMEGGTVLPRAINWGLITRAMRDSLIAKVQDMHRVLVSARWAHTDVKPENLVIRKRSDTNFDVYLIDCDFALPFGEDRIVSTPGVNASYGADYEVVNEDTDTMGFNAVIKAIQTGAR